MLAGEIKETRGYERTLRDNNVNGNEIMRGWTDMRVKEEGNVNKRILKRHLGMRIAHSRLSNTGKPTSKMATGHPGYFTAEGKKEADNQPAFSSDEESDILEIPFQTIPWWTRPWKLLAGWKPTITVPT